MDTVNHCFIKRTDLKAQLAMKNQSFQLIIPADEFLFLQFFHQALYFLAWMPGQQQIW
ncbi:hypothetical protein SAMN05444410_102222 [Hydrobacter penzbergensis]|uniref:Uncharacterized protein n=1 Tax=Hydrobacter penzbergensis TaxID=1235997 RepID=A0A8X8IEG8_9BACT|nr:hypothetical protein SAMN05444410_102222 [Hydrobacter penzbergensis]